MYIFINSDLKMREGRSAAQIAHITHSITDAIVRDIYETIPTPEYCSRYLQWCNKPTMVILRATQSQLHDILNLPETCPFYDDISNSRELTTVGIFPRTPGIDKRYDFSDYKLL